MPLGMGGSSADISQSLNLALERIRVRCLVSRYLGNTISIVVNP
jgi:hypothetical protein